MSKQLPEEVQTDLNNGFSITDDSYFQRVKKLGNGHYHFKSGHSEYTAFIDGLKLNIGEISGIVKYSELTEQDKKDAISCYYDSLEHLRKTCSDEEEYQFLICECYYEQNYEQ